MECFHAPTTVLFDIQPWESTVSFYKFVAGLLSILMPVLYRVFDKHRTCRSNARRAVTFILSTSIEWLATSDTGNGGDLSVTAKFHMQQSRNVCCALDDSATLQIASLAHAQTETLKDAQGINDKQSTCTTSKPCQAACYAKCNQ